MALAGSGAGGSSTRLLCYLSRNAPKVMSGQEPGQRELMRRSRETRIAAIISSMFLSPSWSQRTSDFILPNCADAFSRSESGTSAPWQRDPYTRLPPRCTRLAAHARNRRSLRSSLEVFRYYALRTSQTITPLINMLPTIRYPNILAFSGKIFGFRSDA
jgi:hypothetical protein